ncbi:bifunctional Pumilio RNA-binding repeat/Armadillo-like helical/Pumilio [Babesia duncani]|uniref:Bifunctional Pumilio RNA-binding repeat/Armadillo-like helical/Pumilio n=1 Tax=Babesia duncani TaxID=323732 RepID=A0AAD9PP96_9APIC|nr:bifunctional Pumilio RNA-binding repeat/Armadillo-like helical/Pumilio [Babesia duncani]
MTNQANNQGYVWSPSKISNGSMLDLDMLSSSLQLEDDSLVPILKSTGFTELLSSNSEFYNSFIPNSEYNSSRGSSNSKVVNASISTVDMSASEILVANDGKSAIDFESMRRQLTDMSVKMDSLTENVLKQLETPQSNTHEDNILNYLEPKFLQRLCCSGVDYNSSVSPMGTANFALSSSANDFIGSNLCESVSNKNDEMKLSPLHLGETAFSMGSIPMTHRYNPPRHGLRRRGRRENRQSHGSLHAQRFNPPRRKTLSSSVPAFTNHNSHPGSWLTKDSFTIDEIRGNVTSIAKDQAGCRMLQRLLEFKDPILISTIVEEVLDNLFDLMTDPFGNYLCQKLMGVCNQEQIAKIISAVGPDFVKIGLNMHGTRAVQRLLEVLTTPDHIEKVTKALSHGVVDLVNDLNGNHIIQKCLFVLSNENCGFIYKAINEKCVQVATHRHGCCVMQRCIDAANAVQRQELIEAIILNALELVQDAYGNYVVQYVLKLKIPSINRRIVMAVAAQTTELAKQKFSSNVVERCLIYCCQDIRTILISQFIEAPVSVLKDLILDPFGNYVIQRVLNVAQPQELHQLLEKIQPHMDEIKVASSGKKIAAKITRRHYLHDKGQGYPMRLSTRQAHLSDLPSCTFLTSKTSGFSCKAPTHASYTASLQGYKDQTMDYMSLEKHAALYSPLVATGNQRIPAIYNWSNYL